MDFLDVLGDLFNGLGNLPTYEKPRRVFTRGFVAFCIFVAAFELIALNLYYSKII
jgi:hypothetical protein